MGTIQTLLQVKADATQAVSGLKPLQTSLNETAASAETTEAALKGLDGSHKVNLNTQAITNAETEIGKLRASIREQLALDVNADTRPAQTRIRQLQSSIKTLSQEDHEVKVDVAVNESVTGSLSRGGLAGLAQGAASAGLSALPGKLGAVTGAARAAGPALEEAGVAALGLDAAAGTVATGGLLLIPIVLAGIAAAAVDVGFKLAGPAADVETLQTSLNSLTGGKGIETLQFLQQWAKETPFTLDQAIQSFKLLSAAGVPLNQMSTALNNLGNVAANTGTDLGALTLPISQMISSGKASYENLQQLTELSGVPAFALLANKLHLTTAEVQKLATEGKLGKEAVALLLQEMGNWHSGGMEAQAKTLNGQLSSLQDTMTQTKQTVSAAFLPAMESITPVLQDLADIAQNFAIIWLAAVQKVTDNPITKSLLLPLSLEAKGLHLAKGASDQLVKSLGLAKDHTDDFAGGTADSKVELDNAADAAKQYAEDLKNLQQAVTDTTDALGKIGENIRTRISFIISADDAREAVEKAIKGDKTNKPVSLPANLNITQIAGLGDHQQELITNISDFAQQGLEEGARRAKLDPNFDVRSFDLKVRRQTGQLLIKAGVDPKQVNRVLDNVIGIPRTAVITAAMNSEKAQRQLDHFLHPHRVAVVPYIDAKTARAASNNVFSSILTGGQVAGKKAPVLPSVDPAAAAGAVRTLNDVALPGGAPRPAKIKASVDVGNVGRILDDLARDRFTTIFVNTVHTGTPSGTPTPTPNRGLVGAAPNLAPQDGTTKTQTTSDGTITQLAPKVTPVKVFLDGAEIATKLELRTQRATVGRRVA